MAQVTIQVLDGLERGQVFSDLPTPVTIGREDDNVIRLNDERVSRFHAKIQEDGGRIILTDLDSTNGTRVNGRAVQLRVLQAGDQLLIGRCLLLFGSQQDIESLGTRVGADGEAAPNRTLAVVSDGDESEDDAAAAPLFPNGPPDPPEVMEPVLRAQVSDLVAYSHDRIRSVLEKAMEDSSAKGKNRSMRIKWDSWQRLLQLEMELANYLRQIAEPD